MSSPLLFGYISGDAQPRAHQRLIEFAVALGARSGLDICVAPIPANARLVELMTKNELHLAWLSPIPFLELTRRRLVVPLVANQRGRNHYLSALITTRDRKVTDLGSLRGLDVAWVDPFSASGFAIPRIQFSMLGIDPRTAFRKQRFYGSHQAVVRAVASGTADFGATYAALDARERCRGPWSVMPGLAQSIRVVGTIGPVPPDVIVAASHVERSYRARIRRALLSMAIDPTCNNLLQDVFGTSDMRKGSEMQYVPLHHALKVALTTGILDVGKATTRPVIPPEPPTRQRL